MGQIQYSEKYFDDIYEYRSVTSLPRLIYDYGLFFFFFLCCDFLHRHGLIFMVFVDGCFRHVVLTPDVAKLLPKNRLLSEVSNFTILLCGIEIGCS